jgi:hypothetical protein
VYIGRKYTDLCNTKDLSTMFNVTAAPSRFSQRFTGARTRRAALRANRPATAQRRASFGESFAVGLGCDTYKRQS